MNHQKYFLKIVFSIASILLISNDFLLTTNARIKTKEESSRFLNEYCIEVVNAIKDAYETQIIAIKNNYLKKFGEKGRWIGGLSDVYSKLCKD